MRSLRQGYQPVKKLVVLRLRPIPLFFRVRFEGAEQMSGKAYYDQSGVTIYHGDVLEVLRTLPAGLVQCVVTSPPYWGLRDYGIEGQLGLEKTQNEYTAKMVEVFSEVRRVLKDDGVLWLNLGDSYCGGNRGGYDRNRAGSSKNKGHVASDFHAAPNRMSLPGFKDKDLIGIPWMVAFALRSDGWYLRSDIIWSKPNPMPESVKDRPTKSHEYIFLLSKSASYYYDSDAIKEKAIYFYDDRKGRALPEHKSMPTAERNGIRPKLKRPSGWATGKDHSAIGWATESRQGRDKDKQRGHGRRHAGFNDRWDAMDKTEQCGDMRNKRSVWTVATKPYPNMHFATFPPDLIKPCVMAGSRVGDVVLDPFHGSGTSGEVAHDLGRKYIGIELKKEYIDMSLARFRQEVLPL